MEEFLKSMGAGASGAVVIYLIKFLFDLALKHTDRSIEHKNAKSLLELHAKIDKINSTDRYKFERAHLKRIEIAEGIMKLFRRFYDNLFIPTKIDLTDNNSKKIKECLDELSELIGLAKLYLSENIFNELISLHSSLVTLSKEHLFLFVDNKYQISNDLRLQFVDKMDGIFEPQLGSISELLRKEIIESSQAPKELGINI